MQKCKTNLFHHQVGLIQKAAVLSTWCYSSKPSTTKGVHLSGICPWRLSVLMLQRRKQSFDQSGFPRKRGEIDSPLEQVRWFSLLNQLVCWFLIPGLGNSVYIICVSSTCEGVPLQPPDFDRFGPTASGPTEKLLGFQDGPCHRRVAPPPSGAKDNPHKCGGAMELPDNGLRVTCRPQHMG